MTRWEYKGIYVNENFVNELRKLGEAGWELVLVDTAGYFWFKRPIE